jgi:hypothetical protein
MGGIPTSTKTPTFKRYEISRTTQKQTKTGEETFSQERLTHTKPATHQWEETSVSKVIQPFANPISTSNTFKTGHPALPIPELPANVSKRIKNKRRTSRAGGKTTSSILRE